ncbi:MAG: mechanosensitive ion channel family protein [Syntrophaceae bacterium]
MDNLNWPAFGYIVYDGITVFHLLVTLAIASAVFALLELAKKIFLTRFSGLSRTRAGEIYNLAKELVEKTHYSVLLVLSIYAASFSLALPRNAELIVKTAAMMTFLVQAGIWGNHAITFWLENYKKKKLREDAVSVTMVTALAFFVRVIVWAVMVLIALDHFGVNITALVAGLGVGGVAVALAVQNILKDVFASLSIVLDKPFVIGDFIVVDNYMGTVEDIGLKTTRIRSLTGEQLVFPNSNLLESRIKNFRDQRERRVVFSIGVVYETSLEQIRAIPGMIRGIIESQENTRFDRSHFNAFGDSALGFETVYWITVSDYNIFMDTQQRIYLEILDRFEKEGIQFAYPTRTLFFKTEEMQDLPGPSGKRNINAGRD